MTSDLLTALEAARRLAETGERPAGEGLAAMRRYGSSNGPPFDDERAERDAARAALEAILMAPNGVAALEALRDAGALARLLPELADAIGFDQRSRHHDMSVDEHILAALAAAAELGASLKVRLALLLHDAGKPAAAWRGEDGRWHYYANPKLGKDGHQAAGARLARRALERLGYDEPLVAGVERLVANHMLWPTRRLGRIRELREELGDELLDELFVHRRADSLGKADDGGESATEMLADLDDMQRQLDLVRRQDDEDAAGAGGSSPPAERDASR